MSPVHCFPITGRAICSMIVTAIQIKKIIFADPILSPTVPHTGRNTNPTIEPQAIILPIWELSRPYFFKRTVIKEETANMAKNRNSTAEYRITIFLLIVLFISTDCTLPNRRQHQADCRSEVHRMPIPAGYWKPASIHLYGRTVSPFWRLL